MTTIRVETHSDGTATAYVGVEVFQGANLMDAFNRAEAWKKDLDAKAAEARVMKYRLRIIRPPVQRKGTCSE